MFKFKILLLQIIMIIKLCVYCVWNKVVNYIMLKCVSVVKGSERPLSQLQSVSVACSHLMLFTWNSLGCGHQGGGGWWYTRCIDQGGEGKGAMSTLISFVSHYYAGTVYEHYTALQATQCPSPATPVCSPKPYFPCVCSQQQLNRISIQMFLTPVALDDRRFITLL